MSEFDSKEFGRRLKNYRIKARQLLVDMKVERYYQM